MLYLTRNRNHDGAARPVETGMDRLFDEMTRGLGFVPERGAAKAFAPVFDVSETEADWRVKAELPGVAPEEVEVSVVGNVLTIRGEKKSETAEGESPRRVERRHGTFVRSIEFPSDVDAARVEAKAKNGVLTIVLPKAEAARPKTVAVKVE